MADVSYVDISQWAVINGQRVDRNRTAILIKGEITKKDEALLAIAVAQAGDNSFVYLDSPGGEVFPAMRMGRLLRSAHAVTMVRQGDSCSSACVFLLASGVDRWAGSKNSRVGLHRPIFPQEMFAGLEVDDARRYYDELLVECQKYLREMGIDDKLFADMLRVPSQEIRFVDTEYCDSVSLTGHDPAYREWVRARSVKGLGRDFVERRDAAMKCIDAGGEGVACAKRYGITTLFPENEKEESVVSLVKENAVRGAVKQPTGFFYKEIRTGTGTSPKATDKVIIHYRAAFTEGTVFDSSVERREPVSVRLSGVLPCWTQGIQLMKKGGKALLVCPSDLAYGDAGRPPKIKGGATLVFEIELLSIEK